MKCEDCKYWNQEQDHDQFGTCRHDAPKGHNPAIWPVTVPIDWCGEFEEKE